MCNKFHTLLNMLKYLQKKRDYLHRTSIVIVTRYAWAMTDGADKQTDRERRIDSLADRYSNIDTLDF